MTEPLDTLTPHFFLRTMGSVIHEAPLEAPRGRFWLLTGEDVGDDLASFGSDEEDADDHTDGLEGGELTGEDALRYL